LNVVSSYNFGSCTHGRHGAAVLVGRQRNRPLHRFLRNAMSTDHVLQFDPSKSAWMFLAPLAADFEMIRRHLFALLFENRNDVGRRATPQARDEQLQGTGRGFTPAFHIDRDGMAARSGGDKELVAGILDEGGWGRGMHPYTNSTRYTVNFDDGNPHARADSECAPTHRPLRPPHAAHRQRRPKRAPEDQRLCEAR